MESELLTELTELTELRGRAGRAGKGLRPRGSGRDFPRWQRLNSPVAVEKYLLSTRSGGTGYSGQGNPALRG